MAGDLPGPADIAGVLRGAEPFVVGGGLGWRVRSTVGTRRCRTGSWRAAGWGPSWTRACPSRMCGPWPSRWSRSRRSRASTPRSARGRIDAGQRSPLGGGVVELAAGVLRTLLPHGVDRGRGGGACLRLRADHGRVAVPEHRPGGPGGRHDRRVRRGGRDGEPCPPTLPGRGRPASPRCRCSRSTRAGTASSSRWWTAAGRGPRPGGSSTPPATSSARRRWTWTSRAVDAPTMAAMLAERADPGPGPHGGCGGRRAPAVGRPRPALADRLRGHAARAPDHAGRAPRRRRHAGRARLEAPRVVERPDVFTLRRGARPRTPSASSPAWSGRPGASRSATAPGRGSSSTSRPRCPGVVLARRAEVIGPLRAVKDAAEIEALRGGGRGRRPHRRRAPGRRDPAGRADRGRGLGRPGPPHPRRGPPPGELRHRRGRAQRGQPAPRGGRPGHRGRRGRAVRLRRHDARRRRRRLLLRHHPLRSTSASPGRGGRGLRRAARRPAGRGRRRGRSARRARRSTPPPAGHRRRRLRRPLHPPHRPRHRRRGARGPLHRVGQRRAAGPGHAFSIEPGIYVPGRFGFRLEDIVVAADDGPDRSTRPTTAWWWSRPDRGAALAQPRSSAANVVSGPGPYPRTP